MAMSLQSRRVQALVMVLALTSGPGSAKAHAILTGSRPAPGGVLPPGHQALQFHFNSRIDQLRSRLTLTGPSGEATVLPIHQDGPADELATEADLTVGRYRLRWQALAVDGHITRGDVPFSVTAAGQPGAAAAAP